MIQNDPKVPIRFFSFSAFHLISFYVVASFNFYFLNHGICQMTDRYLQMFKYQIKSFVAENVFLYRLMINAWAWIARSRYNQLTDSTDNILRVRLKMEKE